jgi:hypothetical protein
VTLRQYLDVSGQLTNGIDATGRNAGGNFRREPTAT